MPKWAFASALRFFFKMNSQMADYLNESSKLDGSNYINWKFKLQTLLEGQNTYSIVISDEGKPTVANGGTNATAQEWEKRELKAKVLLKLSVKDCIIPHIRDCKTANEIWTTLKDMYEIKNTSRTLFLRKKILSIKMEENESVSSFLSRIKEVKDKLSDIGRTVENDDLVTITMNGMTDDYQMFITGLNAREKPPSFEELTGILLHEEERRSSLKPQDPDLALITKFKPKGRAMANQRRGNTSEMTPQGMTSYRNDSAPECFYCGKIGHIAKFCCKKKANQERYNQKRYAGHLADADADTDPDQNLEVRLFMAEGDTAIEEDE